MLGSLSWNSTTHLGSRAVSLTKCFIGGTEKLIQLKFWLKVFFSSCLSQVTGAEYTFLFKILLVLDKWIYNALEDKLC